MLLLDEPSNDLDLQTLQTLEDYLTDTFNGMLVIVSHDNFLVNKVADHLFVFEGDGIVRDFQGSYTDYLGVRKRAMRGGGSGGEKGKRKGTDKAAGGGGGGLTKTNPKAAAPPAKSSAPAAPAAAKKKGKSKLTFPEQKEMQKLESAIAKLLAAIEQKEEEVGSMESVRLGYSHQAALQEEADNMRGEMEEKEMRWLELAEKDA